MIYDGTTVYPVLNGATEGAGGTVSSSTYGTGLGIGQTSTSTILDRDWDGLIEEVTIWNTRVLTTAELADWYNSGNGKAYPYIPDYT